jgi:hypothetical protein
MFVFSYRIPSDPAVLILATVLYLFAGVFFGMMMGNATGSQSAAIQGVQMGSFLLSLLGRVEDWRRCSVGPAYLLLPVSVGSASLSGP